MKYKTKQKRLIALTDAWVQKHDQTMFSTDVVSQWVYANGLWPVPKRGDPEAECLAWEQRLEKIMRVRKAKENENANATGVS